MRKSVLFIFHLCFEDFKMKQTNKTDFPILYVESFYLFRIDSHLRGVIRTRWVNENLHFATSIFAQIVALLNNILVQKARNSWFFFSYTLSLVFDIPKWKIQRIVDRKKKNNQGIPLSPNH
jgi:hypothetical protein